MEVVSLLNYLLLILVSQSVLVWNNINAVSSVTYLEPGTKTQILPEVGKFGYNIEKLNTFCYKGGEKTLQNFLQSIVFSVDIDNDEFSLFYGNSPKTVQQAYDDHRSLFSFNWFSSSKKRIMNLNPFNKTCIGLKSAEPYTISLNQIQVDPTKLLFLIGGNLLFFMSGPLSHNSLFFYISGISVGNIASLIVLIWFFSKLFPRKPFMYGILATGWGLVAYIGNFLFENVQTILMTYSHIVIMYILITSFLSFGICYYKGPPKQQKSKNLIKWTLQIAGLVFIFFSSDFKEASIGAILISIFLYYFPSGIFNRIQKIYRRRFPKPRKLLTKEEFEEQGRIETEKALAELREYLKSPKCKTQWSLVKNLSQPIRFASFVEGDDHVTLDETLQYDSIMNNVDTSDDEESSDEFSDESEVTIDESIAVNENFQRINKSKLPFTTPNTQNGNTERKSKLPISARMLNGNASQKVNSFRSEVTSSTPNTESTRPRRSNSIRSYRGFNFSDDEDDE